jgi:lysozyme family protein
MANFNVAANLSLNNEAGFQKNPKDPGNYNSLNQLVGTNRGIAAPTYEAYIKRVPTEQDMRAITPEIARAIYKVNYWNPLKLDLVPDQYLANQLFDISLSGIRNATLIIQRALNDTGYLNIKVDGIFGPQTFNAIIDLVKKGLAEPFNQNLVSRRIAFFKADGNPEFIKGWIARAETYLNYHKIALSTFPIFLIGAAIVAYYLTNK